MSKVSYYLYRITHRKEVPVNKKMADDLVGPTGAKVADRCFKIRALDRFDNVYYFTVILLKGGHAAVAGSDPQTMKDTVGYQPHAMAFLDEGVLTTAHPPLCPNCWTKSKAVYDTMTTFRKLLENEKVLSVKGSDYELSPEMEELLDTSREEIHESLRHTGGEVDDLISKYEGNDN